MQPAGMEVESGAHLLPALSKHQRKKFRDFVED